MSAENTPPLASPRLRSTKVWIPKQPNGSGGVWSSADADALDVRVIVALESIELADTCTDYWKLDELSPLEMLATDCEPTSWHFRCGQHGTVFSVAASRCPASVTLAPGQAARVSNFIATGLIKQGRAELAGEEQVLALLPPGEQRYMEWLKGLNDDYDL